MRAILITIAIQVAKEVIKNQRNH